MKGFPWKHDIQFLFPSSEGMAAVQKVAITCWFEMVDLFSSTASKTSFYLFFWEICNRKRVSKLKNATEISNFKRSRKLSGMRFAFVEMPSQTGRNALPCFILLLFYSSIGKAKMSDEDLSFNFFTFFKNYFIMVYEV